MKLADIETIADGVSMVEFINSNIDNEPVICNIVKELYTYYQLPEASKGIRAVIAVVLRTETGLTKTELEELASVRITHPDKLIARAHQALL